MRGDRRHELKENELAQALTSAQSFLRARGGAIALVVVALLAVCGVFGYTMSSRAAHLEDTWRKKAELSYPNPTDGKESLQKLGTLIQQSSDAAFLQAALVEQGTQALRLALQSDLPPDGDLNDIARNAFEQLRTRFPSNLFAHAAALSGLATVAENDFALDLSPKHKDEAKRHLTEIVGDAALQTTPFHRVATDRLAQLDATFSVVRFAPTPPAPPVDAVDAAPGQPAPVMQVGTPPKPVQPIEVPQPEPKLIKVRFEEDGTIVPVEEEDGDEKK